MDQKITQKQLEQIAGEEVMRAIHNNEIELLKRCEFDPRVHINKLKITKCMIELATDNDKEEEAISCSSCKRTWISLKGFSEHLVNKECKKYK